VGRILVNAACDFFVQLVSDYRDIHGEENGRWHVQPPVIERVHPALIGDQNGFLAGAFSSWQK